MNILIYSSKICNQNQIIKVFNIFNIRYTIGKSKINDKNNVINEILKIMPTIIIFIIDKTYGINNDDVIMIIDYLKYPNNLTNNLYTPFVLTILCHYKYIYNIYLGNELISNIDDILIDNIKYNNRIETKNSVKCIDFKEKFRELFIYISNINFIQTLFCNCLFNKNNTIFTNSTSLVHIEPIINNSNIDQYRFSKNDKIRHRSLDKQILDINSNLSYHLQKTPSDTVSDNNIYALEKIMIKSYRFPNNKNFINDKLLILKKSNLLDNKTILVTGGCGFIASHFINYIFYKYEKVNIINIDAMYYCANENNIKENIRNSKRYIFIKGNICEKEILDELLIKYKINFVINFAAQSHVQNSFEDSLQYTKDNILGTHTLLESCRNYGLIEKFIHVSTDEVYGESMKSINEIQKTEYSTLCPTNPYAGTKAGAELIAQTYAHSFKMPIIITRGNNVYGPNQYPEKLIPKFIYLLQNNKKVTIQGDGSALRSFINIYDTVTAFDIILNKGIIGEIYNIGCDEYMEYSVLDIAKILIKLIKNTDEYNDWIEYIEDRPFNDARYYINNNKLKNLGWNITIKFEDGIKELI